jgi:hypothetical protein
MSSRNNSEPVARLLYRVTDAAEALSLSRAKVYEPITSGALRSVRIDGHAGSGPLTWRRLSNRCAARRPDATQESPAPR